MVDEMVHCDTVGIMNNTVDDVSLATCFIVEKHVTVKMEQCKTTNSMKLQASLNYFSYV